MESNDPGSDLRKALGTWKAIGASNSVLSWIGYGFEFRFIHPPKRFLFANSPTCASSPGAVAFVDKEIATHVADGIFSETTKANVHVCNPIQVEPKGVGEFCNCHNMKYPNGFAASPSFAMDSLQKDVPLLVEPGDILFTEDLAKVYYKVPFAKESRKFQCFFLERKILRGCGPSLWLLSGTVCFYKTV